MGTEKMGSAEDQHPRGFVPIGIFFLFGATMAAYAAVTLLKPGTALDALWTLNKAGHAQLASLGKGAGLGFVLLSALLCAAAVGWFRRRYWGWVLFATDGLHELRNGEGVEFCTSRMEEVWAQCGHTTAAESVDFVFDRQVAFSAGNMPDDDITAVVLKVLA
jgi:hypothetical protein